MALQMDVFYNLVRYEQDMEKHGFLLRYLLVTLSVTSGFKSAE